MAKQTTTKQGDKQSEKPQAAKSRTVREPEPDKKDDGDKKDEIKPGDVWAKGEDQAFVLQTFTVGTEQMAAIVYNYAASRVFLDPVSMLRDTFNRGGYTKISK
jgi:hypothetical protein